MTYLALGDFLDVVSKSGSPKATKVAQIKNRGPYQPATDFYKQLREGLVATHKDGKSKSSLQAILAKVGQKKHANYQTAINGYRKWWGNKSPAWFDPPSAVYSKNGFDIGVNPELGLEFNGQRHVIKLYLKDEPLTKLRIDLITALMTHVLAASVGKYSIMSVLDVRRAKLISGAGAPSALIPIVDAELAYIATLWPSL